MGMAEARYCDAGKKVQVDVAIGVGQRRAVSVIECEASKLRDSLTAYKFETRPLLRSRACCSE